MFITAKNWIFDMDSNSNGLSVIKNVWYDKKKFNYVHWMYVLVYLV